MHVGEDQFGARGAGCDEAHDGGYGFGGEIVCDSFPEKYAALRWIEACAAQNGFERLAIEINLYKGEVRGFAIEELSQLLALGGESLRMVNFENFRGAQFGNAEGAAIESGAEDYDLADTVAKSGDESVVNPARAGDS